MDPRATFDPKRFGDLAALRAELADAQLMQIAHRKRAIVLFEGPEGAGKKFALKRLTGSLDPCHFKVNCIAPDRRQASDGHWLARYWRELPAAGRCVFFYRSWYRRVLDDRLDGKLEGKGLARAYDEINEFEAQQRDHGTLIVKLYFDVSAKVQEQRLGSRESDPWRRTTEFAPSLRVGHPQYAKVLEDLRTFSDMRWSPWHIVSSDDAEDATLTAMRAVVNAIRGAVPAEPPEIIRNQVPVG